jgi:hypothetical protein
VTHQANAVCAWSPPAETGELMTGPSTTLAEYG